VTIGTGLTDVAGNPLASAQSATFHVFSSDLVFLSSDPADGASDVNRSAVITLLFSDEMDLSSFAGEIGLNAGAGNDLVFDLHEGAGSTVIVDPDGDLPASTTINLMVSTAVQDVGGRNLSAPVELSFTTGQDVDTTPPTIVGFEPASGSVVDPGTTFFRVTFSEPVIPDDADPVRVNAALFGLVESHDTEPVWSADFTTLTVSLPTPLPAGLPMEVTFDDYRDLAGNEQTTATTWTATVAGTADYYPLADGLQFVYLESGADGTIGNPEPTFEWSNEVYIQVTAQGGGVYHRGWYDPGFGSADDWDIIQKSDTALEYLGFAEVDDGQTVQVDFASPLTFVALPPSGTWSDQTTATIPGEGTLTIAGEGEMVAEQDVVWLAGGDDHPELFWKDVRLVVIDHTISAGDDIVETGVDSLWLAPTVGIIRYATYNEDPMAGEWYRDGGTLLPPGR
jgi:hypothetical protein